MIYIFLLPTHDFWFQLYVLARTERSHFLLATVGALRPVRVYLK